MPGGMTRLFPPRLSASPRMMGREAAAPRRRGGRQDEDEPSRLVLAETRRGDSSRRLVAEDGKTRHPLLIRGDAAPYCGDMRLLAPRTTTLTQPYCGEMRLLAPRTRGNSDNERHTPLFAKPS